MTITFPDSMRAIVEAKAKAAGFSSVDTYVMDRYLQGEVASTAPDEDEATDEQIADVLDDFCSSLTPKNRAELEAMLDEGMNSGPGVEAAPEFWAERRRVLFENIARRNGTAP